MEQYVISSTLGMLKAIKLSCSRILSCKGRSRRSEFWWFTFALIVIDIFVVFPFSISFLSSVNLFLGFVPFYFLLLLIPACIRRYHDAGHNGWWCLIVTVALIEILWAIAGLSELMDVMSNPNMASIHGISGMSTFDLVIKFCNDKIPGGFVGCCVLTLIAIALIATGFIFFLQDSEKETNKYGDSPKYLENSESTEQTEENIEV